LEFEFFLNFADGFLNIPPERHACPGGLQGAESDRKTSPKLGESLKLPPFPPIRQVLKPAVSRQEKLTGVNQW
jgi:hypothetical protein